MAKAAAPDMFASALKAPKVEDKKKKKASDKVQIDLGKDLTTYAASVAVIKSLDAIKGVVESKLKDTMSKLFAHMGMEKNAKPTNFEGVGPNATASCELRKRSSASVLTVEEAALLTEKGIALEEKVIREEAYLFNPAILEDPILRKKVSEVLAKVDFGGVAPIIHQEREVRSIIAETSMDQMFQLATDENDANSYLPMVGVLAIKPKFEGTLSDAVSYLEAQGVSLS